MLAELHTKYLVVCLAGAALLGVRATGQTTISLSLTTGEGNKVSLGSFSAGTLVQVSVTGQGDLANANFQTNPDGSLAAVAGSPWGAANAGAAYPNVGGFPSGDGFNHFVGGGFNYDFGGGSGWMFAGAQTTDTTAPIAIRAGAVVGTFVVSPTRTDWFAIGYGGTFSVPPGGADFFVAVNDSASGDNHGSYSLTYTVVPEPSAAALWLALGAGGIAVIVRRSSGIRRTIGSAVL